MPTFVEEVQAVDDDNAAAFGRRLADRVETLGEALDLLEDWTESSRDTGTELSSKYETAKQLARDEIRDATDDDGDAADIPAEDLLDHPAVSDQTKERLREYGTKLHVFLDEERSYGEARSALARSLDDELDLYKELLAGLQSGDAGVDDARQAIARFAREDSLGAPNRTAADVLLESAVDGES
ncbi:MULTISPECIES: hypothetical protein [Halorussus]|uniref:hypothetical protein n=1 Tax=Halorussus TaxID=1070314 RepID=UPI000E21904D|nr:MULTISPECIES: hypothetical protein [Halorussus]NHN58448.1 hypothetical protein [Halorussus sp. JP-T4]